MNHTLENCPLTLNTARICANNALDTSVEVSRIGFSNMKPNAVILVNKNEVFDGIAAASLVHFPINASLLFTDGGILSKETLNEIQRLSPKGYKGIHVILVGNISKNVSSALNDYGFKTRHIVGRNYYETACIIPRIREEFKNIIIISGEDYSEGVITGYWSAHHGDPILYVQKNRIPYCTLEAIKKMHDINIYIIGSTKTISKEVEDYLSNLDNVKHLDRIDGETPYDIAVNFARYKDNKTEFGWGRNYREGHAFTFGELNNPMEIIAGVVFAHMGKHTPALLIEKNRIPDVVERYIKSIKPMPPKGMPKPPFMHGFILGNILNISHKAQIMIEEMISIDHEMMGMNHETMSDMDHNTMEGTKHEMMHKMDHKMMNGMDHEMMHKMDHKMMNGMDHEMIHNMELKMMDEINHKMMGKMDHSMMNDMGHEMDHKMNHSIISGTNHQMMHDIGHKMMDKDMNNSMVDSVNHDTMEMNHDSTQQICPCMMNKALNADNKEITHKMNEEDKKEKGEELNTNFIIIKIDEIID
jgi:hypothetical protein